MKEDYLKSLLENSAQHKAPKDLKKAVLMAIEKGVEDKKERPQNGILYMSFLVLAFYWLGCMRLCL